jgi:hypothetical protein
VVGGVAANVHGSARVTFDLDIVYDPAPDNQALLIRLFRQWRASLKGAPPDLPWVLDDKTLRINPALTLETSHGPLDVMDRIDGVGDYAAVLAHSEEIVYQRTRFRVLDLDSLIVSKRATGRLKDIGPAIELEALREKIRRTGRRVPSQRRAR